SPLLQLPTRPTLYPYTTLFRSFPTAWLMLFGSNWEKEKFSIPSKAIGSFIFRSLESLDMRRRACRMSFTFFLLTVASLIRRKSRSEEHTSELQSREISYAVFCL